MPGERSPSLSDQPAAIDEGGEAVEQAGEAELEQGVEVEVDIRVVVEFGQVREAAGLDDGREPGVVYPHPLFDVDAGVPLGLLLRRQAGGGAPDVAEQGQHDVQPG